MAVPEKPIHLLDGESLTLQQLDALSRGEFHIGLTPEAWNRVEIARAAIDEILQGEKAVYGVNTGFGQFSEVHVASDKLRKLQENLIRSHAAGVGPTMDVETTRALMVLRVNCLAKGYSGISVKTLQGVIDCFNKDCLSVVPEQGTLGASGDLAQLAHLALGMMGEGEMWNPTSKNYESAKDVLAQHGLQPLVLEAKEGLALINGTQFMTAIGAMALVRCENLVEFSDYLAALTVEALRGTKKAFKAEIHQARGHPGQMVSAEVIRSVLHSERFPSAINQSHLNCGKVQDAYSLRCTPQVHGVVRETVEFVKHIIEREMNAATDNPMIFQDGSIVSGGNFHGEYPAKALDYLAIAIHELSNLSINRIERLMNEHLSDLPPFLVREGGLNSGFMIAQCTAAALVSENKGLCHPSSVDSIPTSNQKEDHVSMGGWSARKCRRVVDNVERVLAIELLAACQAFEFIRPLTSTAPLEALYNCVRSKVPALEEDRYMKPDIDEATRIVRAGEASRAVRQVLAEPVIAPRTADPPS